MKRRDISEEQGLRGGIILEWLLERQSTMVWNGFIWLCM